MSNAVLESIRNTLAEAGIVFREVEHGPTFTSEESAAARGEPLYVGAKALLVKADERFVLFVLPADMKLDSAALRKELNSKKVRFASREELSELTGLVPGSVPPFGPPVLPFELLADEQVGRRGDRVAFNAGSLTHSIVMGAADWERVARPRRVRCARSEAEGG